MTSLQNLRAQTFAFSLTRTGAAAPAATTRNAVARTEAPALLTPKAGGKPVTAQQVGHDARSSFQAALSASITDALLSGLRPRTPERALDEAERLLNPEVNWQQEGTPQTVTHNGADDVSAGKGANAYAMRQVEQNKTLEQQALAKMSPEDRRHYHEVKAAMVDSPDAGLDQLALQKMLLEGKLPGEKDLKGEGTLLDRLADAASLNAFPDDINQAEFVGSLVREVATPSSINQGGKGTCAPTAASIMLARDNPAEYARIARGLAGWTGEVELADGSTLQREPETSFQDDSTGRSIVQRFMAPALMEKANDIGPGGRDYNDAEKDPAKDGSGSTTESLDVLVDALYGKDAKYVDATDAQSQKNAMHIIDHQLSAGNDALVGVEYSPGSYHEVLVTGTSTGEDGKEYVEYINPWGQEEKMPREDFEKKITGVNYEALSDFFTKTLLKTPSTSESEEAVRSI